VLTNEGFNNLNEMMSLYYLITMTREAVTRYEEKFIEFFEDAADFYDEANTGSISDTFPRGGIGCALAQIFTTHEDWPCNDDSQEVNNDFLTQYLTSVCDADGVNIRKDSKNPLTFA